MILPAILLASPYTRWLPESKKLAAVARSCSFNTSIEKLDTRGLEIFPTVLRKKNAAATNANCVPNPMYSSRGTTIILRKAMARIFPNFLETTGAKSVVKAALVWVAMKMRPI